MLLAELKASAESFVRAGSSGRIVSEITAFMRYSGQGWEIPVPLPDEPFGADAAGRLEALFRDAYQRFFGRAIDGLSGLEIEIVTISVKAADKRPAPEPATLTFGSRSVAAPHSRAVFDPSSARALPTGIIARDSLTTGDRVSGPAVVVERETSTVVTAPFDVVMQSDGSLLMLRKEIV